MIGFLPIRTMLASSPSSNPASMSADAATFDKMVPVLKSTMGYLQD